MKFWHVLPIVNHPMLTTHGLPRLNSFSQNMDLDISGYKNQMTKIHLKTYYRKLRYV